MKEIDKVYEVSIMLPKVDFLEGKLIPGAKFFFGLHAEPIGEGEITGMV